MDPIFQSLAPGVGLIERTRGRLPDQGTAEQGYLHCGPVGSGHFVKMVHNGIEYGVMQAYAEGFDIMKNAGSEQVAEDHRFDLPLPEIAELWRRGSVVSSWLLDLTAIALVEDPELAQVHRLRAGLGRGPLDDHGGDRGGRPRRRARPPRSTSASARARSTRTPRRCSRPCACSSAGTSRRRRSA